MGNPPIGSFQWGVIFILNKGFVRLSWIIFKYKCLKWDVGSNILNTCLAMLWEIPPTYMLRASENPADAHFSAGSVCNSSPSENPKYKADFVCIITLELWFPRSGTHFWQYVFPTIFTLMHLWDTITDYLLVPLTGEGKMCHMSFLQMISGILASGLCFFHNIWNYMAYCRGEVFHAAKSKLGSVAE